VVGFKQITQKEEGFLDFLPFISSLQPKLVKFYYKKKIEKQKNTLGQQTET